MWALVLLRSQSDAFLSGKFPRISLVLSLLSPLFWGFYLAHLWKKRQTCEDAAAILILQQWPSRHGSEESQGKSLHTSRLMGLSLKPVKRGEREVVILASSQCSTLTALTESVNMLSCRCREGSDCWKEKRKKRVMDRCHLRIHSQQTRAVCSCLVSLHLPEVWVLPFDSFYPFQQAAHKIKSTEPQLRLRGWHLIWGILEYFPVYL